MELRDLYNAQRQPMNKLQMRGKPVSEGCYHIAVSIWAFTCDDRLSLAKRDVCRPGGLLWEVTSGSALRGEASQEETRRELHEETGISYRMEWLQKLHTKVKGQGIYNHYLLQYPVELDRLQLQEKRTTDATLVDQSTFEDIMRAHILTHPPQLWYHGLKDTLATYFQKSRQRQI